MTTQQNHLLHLLKAAEAAYQAIDEATDIPDLQDGTPLEGWQVERIHNGICSVLVELEEAIDAARENFAPLLPAVFPLGAVVSAPSAQEALSPGQPGQARRYLYRHQTGDWGQVCAEDKALNQAAVEDGNRIFSAYPIDPASLARASATTVSGSSPRLTAVRPRSCSHASTDPVSSGVSA